MSAAKAAKAALVGGSASTNEDETAPPPASDADERRGGDIFELAPQILTLCSGALQPFDFALSPAQHYELYLAGQLFAHLHAAEHGRTSRSKEGAATLSAEQKLRALLFVLHLDYPQA